MLEAHRTSLSIDEEDTSTSKGKTKKVGLSSKLRSLNKGFSLPTYQTPKDIDTPSPEASTSTEVNVDKSPAGNILSETPNETRAKRADVVFY